MSITTVDKITALLEQENPDAPFFVYHEAIKQIRDEVANMNPNGGSQPGALLTADIFFTETDTPGTLTAEFPVVAGTLVANVIVYALAAPWASDTALLSGGDSAFPHGYFWDADLGINGLNAPYSTLNPSSFSGLLDASGGSGDYANGGAPFPVVIGNASLGAGVPYATDDTLTFTIVTTAAAPIVPAGVTLLKILYFTPAPATNAA